MSNIKYEDFIIVTHKNHKSCMLFINDFSWMKCLILSWPYLLGSGTRYWSSWSWRACLSDCCYQRNLWVLFPATWLKFWYVMLVAWQETNKVTFFQRVSCSFCEVRNCELPSENCIPQSTVLWIVHVLQFCISLCLVFMCTYWICLFISLS